LRPRTRRLAALGAGALVATMCAIVLLATQTTPADSESQSPSTLSLLAVPGLVTPSQPFQAQLAIRSGLDRSSLDLQVGLYPRLPYRSEFDETLNGTPVGQALEKSSPFPLASLPGDARGVDLTVPVEAGGSTTPGSGPFTANLDCPNCGAGVYPLLIQLTDAATSAVVAHLLTYLVYTYPSDPQPLRFALVVPISTQSQASQTPSPRGALPPTRSAALSKLGSLVVALSGARIPLTLVPSPATVSSLVTNPSVRSEQVLAKISELVSTSATDRQTLCGPFADVDVGQLASAGLTSEVSRQVHEGASVLKFDLHASCGSSGIFVSGNALDQSALNALANLGYQDVVVPQNSVTGPAPSATWSRLLDLGDTRAGSLLAKTVDPGLSSHLQLAAHTDPVLAADRVLAELELIYYEYPATENPRGVVAVAPASWNASPTYVTDLLEGLEANPVVRPVDLTTFFSEVPVGGTTGTVSQPSSRRPAVDGATAKLPARAIRLARARLQEFAGAVTQSTAGAYEAEVLDQLLLVAESRTLGTKSQQAALSDASEALSSQLHSLSVNAGEIRLTSNAALVPITVVKDLPYPVTGVISVTSDKLTFPQGSQAPGGICHSPQVHSSAGRSSFSSRCVFAHNTNVVYVDMRTRATGDFRISVALTSPSGSLVLASGQLTVRSMSTSAVSIALSIVAALVLLAWWGRTLWRRRHRRRPAHAFRARARTRAGPDTSGAVTRAVP